MEVTERKEKRVSVRSWGCMPVLIIGQRLTNYGLYFCDQIPKGVFHI